jgi:hypothetical protein
MANLDQPMGFSPKGDVKRCREYVAASAIYPGDCVTLDSAGKAAVAAAGNPLLGVAAEYASGDGQPVKVWDDPDQEFMGQADGSDVDAQTDIGLNYNILATAGNTSYKISRQEIDSSTGATNSDQQLKLLRIDPRPDNALGAQVDCIVIVNNHQLKGGTGTVGV